MKVVFNPIFYRVKYHTGTVHLCIGNQFTKGLFYSLCERITHDTKAKRRRSWIVKDEEISCLTCQSHTDYKELEKLC